MKLKKNIKFVTMNNSTDIVLLQQFVYMYNM